MLASGYFCIVKRSIVIIFLLAIIRVHAQTDTTAIEIVEPPDSTEIGIADGTPVNTEIGPAGGRIRSEDGRIELIFPAGALTQSLTITIQPTTNPAPNGTGKAYQFGPSGTHFKKPVQLIFHYSDKEAKQCPASLMALAMQDEKGRWEFIEYDNWDSASNTLTTSIHHFSGASNVDMLALHPEKSMISTGETIKVKLFELFEKVKGKKAPDHGWGKLAANQWAFRWWVNGINNGDDQVGHLFDMGELEFKGKPGKGNTHSPNVRYQAPYFLPKENPVKIVTQIAIASSPDVDEPERIQRILSCEVEIFDEYKIKVTDTLSIWEGRGQYIVDSGTFLIRVTKNGAVIDDIHNYPPSYFKTPVKKFPCVMEVDFTGCPGTIEITNHVFLVKDDNHPPNIELVFNTKGLINAFRFSEHCRGVPPTPWEYNEVEPIPNIFQFTANGLYQKFPVSSYRISNYTINVIPIRPRE